MLEELSARNPERRRFTPADLEVVLVEALAAVLDQLSDAADRVAAEAVLGTARRPESVRRLLDIIGYDAAGEAFLAGQIDVDPALRRDEATAALERAWIENPFWMEAARAAGPAAIDDPARMVTPDDYGALLEAHPLVRRARGVVTWGGSWPLVRLTVLPIVDRRLDVPERLGPPIDQPLRGRVDRFHDRRGVARPIWSRGATLRSILAPFVEAHRMIGQEVELIDAVLAGITIEMTIGVQHSFFQSEVRAAVEQALGRAQGGFFEPGRLRFGEHVNASDLIHAAVSKEGVDHVTLDRLRRFGSRFLDQARGSGSVFVAPAELATCDNDPGRPERGGFRLTLTGGRRG